MLMPDDDYLCIFYKQETSGQILAKFAGNDQVEYITIVEPNTPIPERFYITKMKKKLSRHRKVEP